MFHHTLQTQTNTERGYPMVRQKINGRTQTKIGRIAGSGRQYDQVGFLSVVDQFRQSLERGWATAQGLDLCSGLTQIIAECMNKGIFVINQYYGFTVTDIILRLGCRTTAGRISIIMFSITTTTTNNRVHHGTRFQFRFQLLRRRTRVVQKCRARSYFRHTVLHPYRSQRQTRVQRPVEPDHTHRTAVPAPRTPLVLLHKLDRPRFRCTRDGHRPGVAEKRVQRVKLVAEVPLDVVDGMDQTGVHFDLTTSNDFDTARYTDP
mmetsp:Transcript_32546/g.48185  ORF Transcript_32546/g.48185 Transcript_32546/m.48185 type:complete len:262 (+) Transcript_32546:457-1242(+)